MTLAVAIATLFCGSVLWPAVTVDEDTPTLTPPPSRCALSFASRRDCAYPGIRPADCLARGCCPETNASESSPSCFFGEVDDLHAEFLPRWHYVPRPVNWMNDPDGPFYDPVHKKYHLFVQYETPRQWGHAVSVDMIRWKQLPQALQTNAWYDAGGVYSGSTTVLDNSDRTPVISYSVSYNTMQALAWPCNRSDPDLVDWCKYEGNPIISSVAGNGTAPPGRDDCTAWRSMDGKSWRMAYGAFINGTGMAVVYQGSDDFKTWSAIKVRGAQHFGSGHVLFSNTGGIGGTMWEMPDFFPLPTDARRDELQVPQLWVLDAVLHGQCYWVMGHYNDTAVAFHPDPQTSLAMGNSTQMFDYDPHYSACRTFKDYKTGRQILTADVYEERPVDSHGGPWGWATVQSLPRSLVLEQTEIGPRLRAEPIAEINSLRLIDTHTGMGAFTMVPGQRTMLAAAGQSLDITVRFALPPSELQEQWRCGLRVLANTFDANSDNNVTDIDSEDTYVEIGLTNEPTLPAPPAPKLARFMPNTDFGGGDNGGSCTTRSNFTTPQQCQASCDASDACQVWTWVRPAASEGMVIAANESGGGTGKTGSSVAPHLDTPRCCFKACHAPGCGEGVCCPGPSPSKTCDSGVKDPAKYHPRTSSSGRCPYCSQLGTRLRVYADTYRAGGTIDQGSIHGGDAFLSIQSLSTGTVELRVLVDRSIITSFVNNGSSAVTTRAYTDGEEAMVFNDGTASCDVHSVHAWNMEEVFPPRDGGFRFPHDS